MDQEVKEIFNDIKNNFFAEDDKAYEKIKCDLKAGSVIHWYDKDDLKWSKEMEYDIKTDPPFSGIIIPIPGTTMQSPDTELETDQCIVVVTHYQAEKEYCQCGWLYMERLIDQKDLVEIFTRDQN